MIIWFNSVKKQNFGPSFSSNWYWWRVGPDDFGLGLCRVVAKIWVMGSIHVMCIGCIVITKTRTFGGVGMRHHMTIVA